MTIQYKTGDVVGECVFLEETYPDLKYNSKPYYHRYAKFRCKCGKEFETGINLVRSKQTRSCGCLRINMLREMVQKPEDYYTKLPEYSVWRAMKARCKDTHVDRKFYFDKGIKVCERWANRGDGFKNFLFDMKKRPSVLHSIDRIDGSKGYFPDNCRWATSYEQSSNKDSNIQISYKGETKCLGHWAKEYEISYSTLRYRIRRGWDMELALSKLSNRGFKYMDLQKETRR